MSARCERLRIYAEGHVEFADGEQAGVLDEAASLEIDPEGLRADLPAHRVRRVAFCHDLSLRIHLNCLCNTA